VYANTFDNRFDNRLYRVNGVLKWNGIALVVDEFIVVAAWYGETQCHVVYCFFVSITPSTKSIKFGRLIERALLYIRAKIGEFGTGGPLERQNRPTDGCKKICNAFVEHHLAERVADLLFW